MIPGAFDRWELIQAQELHNKLRIKQNLQQLNSDISNISICLKKTEAELETLKMAKPPKDMQEMEPRVKKLKVSWRRGGQEEFRTCIQIKWVTSVSGVGGNFADCVW